MKLPTKVCDYCEAVGVMPTFMDGETICYSCLKDRPDSIKEAYAEILKLRQERAECRALYNEMQARINALLKALNRRVEVEQYLWDCFRGKKPLPDKFACRQMAVKLGIPDEHQS